MLSEKNQRLQKKCIDHWQENLMNLMLNKLSGNLDLTEDINIRTSDCAFCNTYLIKNETCDGCPIKERTGKSHCDDSPYHDYLTAYAEFFNERSVPSKSIYKKLFKAIADEINFLEDL